MLNKSRGEIFTNTSYNDLEHHFGVKGRKSTRKRKKRERENKRKQTGMEHRK